MIATNCPRSVRFVGIVSIFIVCVLTVISAFTQSVGINLGSLVFMVVAIGWPAWAMLHGENWGRIGYLIAGPFAFYMGFQAVYNAEFLQGFLYFLTFIGATFYFVAFILLLLPKARNFFLKPMPPSKSHSFGKGFSVLLISFTGFFFAWWWTNLSTALYLLSVDDLQGVLISLGGVSIAVIFGVLWMRIWWSSTWNNITGFILLATGWVLLEHTLCYLGITTVMYFEGYEYAFDETKLIIGGRFLFAVSALAVGMIFTDLSKKKEIVTAQERKLNMSSPDQYQQYLRHSAPEKITTQGEVFSVTALITGIPPFLREPQLRGGESRLQFLIRNYPGEWEIFVEDMKDKFDISAHTYQLLMSADLKISDVGDPIIIPEIQIWAAQRLPTHYRTFKALSGLQKFMQKAPPSPMRVNLTQIIWPRERDPRGDNSDEELASEMGIEVIPMETKANLEMNLADFLPSVQGTFLWIVPGGSLINSTTFALSLQPILSQLGSSSSVAGYFDGAYSLIFRVSVLQEIAKEKSSISLNQGVIAKILQETGYSICGSSMPNSALCEYEEIYERDL